MAFKVKKVEFDCKNISNSVKSCMVEGFVEIAETLNYVPTIKTSAEIIIKDKEAVIKFNRPISSNTVNNILFNLFDRNPSVKPDETEYKHDKQTVEVEFK